MGFFDFLHRNKPGNQTLSVKKLVNECLRLETSGNIPQLQDALYQLYSMINKPGGGRLITDYKEKDNLALCFIFMLKYDWTNDSEIREVWAENGFYCIIDHVQHQQGGLQGQAEDMIILFSLLCVGRDSLKVKVSDILKKARTVRNPIFHPDDYKIGANHIIDQISLLAVSQIRGMSPDIATMIMAKIVSKFNGAEFFEQTIKRRDLMKYDARDIFEKAKFIRSVIESILKDM